MSNFLSAHKMPYQLNPCSQPFRLIRLFLRNTYQTLKAYSFCKSILYLCFPEWIEKAHTKVKHRICVF